MSNQVGSSDMAPDAARWVKTVASFAVRRCLSKQLARYDARIDRFLFVINIIDKHVEGFDTLLQTSFDACPLNRFHNARNNVERKDLFSAAGVAVNGKGDSHAVQRALDRFLTLAEHSEGQGIDAVDQQLRARSWLAVGIKEFVVETLVW